MRIMFHELVSYEKFGAVPRTGISVRTDVGISPFYISRIHLVFYAP